MWVVASLTEQIMLVRIEFTKLRYLPASGSHDRLHQRGDLLERPKGVILPWEVLQVCVGQHQGVNFPMLDHGDSRGTAIVVRVEIRVVQRKPRTDRLLRSSEMVCAETWGETIMGGKSGIRGELKFEPCGFWKRVEEIHKSSIL